MAEIPNSKTIPALLEEQALRYGEREAIVGSGQRMTYKTLYQAVRRVACGMLALGIHRGDNVAVLMGNRPEWIVACLAIQHLGARVVALTTWSTPRELEYALQQADVSALIAVDSFKKHDYRQTLSQIRANSERCHRLRHIVWVSDHDIELARNESELTWHALNESGKQVTVEAVDAAAGKVTGDDIALMLYSSGSTAAPKCVMLQHRAMIENAWHIGERQHTTEIDRVWLAVSLFWSFGSANAMMNSLSHGGCVVLQEVFDPAEALALIERERCTIFYGMPNMVQALDEHPNRRSHDLSSLRSGATIGTPEQLMRVINLGAREICNVYGLTETYGNCAVTDAKEPLEQRINSVGMPLPGVNVRIHDAATGAEMPVGQAGEIRVKGYIFAGYYKDEEKTREAFDTDGYFRTGDLGFMDATGRLFYRGRIKEMIKSGGINIAPIEVEETLMRYPSVRTAYVVGLPDPVVDEVLAAVIVLQPGSSPCTEEIIAFCRSELAAYKVPSTFRFISHEELPLTVTGKVLKMGLPALFSTEKTLT